jgi:hypothetical protein
MSEPTKVKPNVAGYTEPPAKHEVSNDESGVYKTMKRVLAEELQKVISVTEGGETKSMTKAAVIAGHLVNRAMAGDRTLQLLLLKMDLPEPPTVEAEVFRFTLEQGEVNIEECLKRGREYQIWCDTIGSVGGR